MDKYTRKKLKEKSKKSDAIHCRHSELDSESTPSVRTFYFFLLTFFFTVRFPFPFTKNLFIIYSIVTYYNILWKI